MNAKRIPLTSFIAACLLGMLAPAIGQTIYSPYAITTMRTQGSSGSPLYVDQPYDVCVYQFTNIYVVCYFDNTIRKISTTDGTNWTISLFAGSPNAYGTNDGVGVSARFLYPNSAATDSAGNIYVSDSGNYTIRKITPAGVVTTFAGTAGVDGNADGPGNVARFYNTVSVAADSNDNIYVADAGNNRLRKITPGGDVSTLAIGAPAVSEFSGGLCVDASGNVFNANSYTHTIRKFTPGGGITTIAGLQSNIGSTDGTNSDARFNVPNDIAVDSAGNLYVSEGGNSTIRKITPVGNDWVVRTAAGVPEVTGAAQGTGSVARFKNPIGIAVDGNGRLYVADTQNSLIRTGIYAGPTNACNSWTNSVDGGWDDPSKWSAGVAPSLQDEQNYITNAGSKNVYIDSGVAATNLNIYNLTISSSGNDVNALALVDAGAVKQLFVQQILKVGSGGNVTLLNSALKVGLEFDIGFQSGGAVLDIQGGGRVTAAESYVGNEASSGSSVNVGGTSAVWTNQQVLVVGNYSHDNGVLIENGGKVVNLGLGAIGVGASNNTVAVTGAGSEFRNSSYMIVGDDGGSGNELSIENGAKAYVGYGDGSELDIGTGGGDNNTVFVEGEGSLLICSGPLQLTLGGGGGDNTLSIFNGGKVITPLLLVSNLNSVELAGGTLETGGTSINNGLPFFAGIGAEPTTLRLNGGTHTFTDGLVITDHAVLTGCGTVNGPVVVDAGGTVLPDSNCAIVFTGPVTNNGTIQTGTGTNVIFSGPVWNRGSLLTNYVFAPPCPIVVTGAIVNLNDSPPSPYVITDGTNSVQFNWSLAGPGASGYIYTTATTAIAAVTNVASVSEITNATVYTFLNSGNVGPLKDAGANGGNAHFVLLRNKSTGHYCAVRIDDVQANGKLNASWWFQSQSGSTNFGCVPPPPPSDPPPASNFTMQAGSSSLALSFATEPGHAYTVQMRTNLTTGPWMSVTNVPGDGASHAIPILPGTNPDAYYRILTQ